jgi:hypothetical protein
MLVGFAASSRTLRQALLFIYKLVVLNAKKNRGYKKREMRKRILIILILLIGSVTLFTFYVNSSSYIKNQDWKYSEGTHIGDWLDENNIEINNRIIKSHQGRAKIVFSFGINLVIEDIETKKKGFYVNKS